MMTTCLDGRSSPIPDCFLPRAFLWVIDLAICTVIYYDPFLSHIWMCVNNTDEATLGNCHMLKLLDEDIETIAPGTGGVKWASNLKPRGRFWGSFNSGSIFQPMSFIIGIRKLIVGVVQNGQLVTNLKTAKTIYWPVFVLWPLLNLEMYLISHTHGNVTLEISKI